MSFKNADKEIQMCKEKLNDLVNRQHDDNNLGEVKMMQNRIDEAWKQEEVYWGQRSRVKWLNWGDRNSSFFHASTIQRRERNRIVRMKDSGVNWIEGQDEVMMEIQRHFLEVYKAEDYVGSYDLLQLFPRLVSSDMNENLGADVREEDVRRVVFSLGSSKAPGPDGFNGLFFQKNWENLKDGVCAAVMEFFKDGIPPPRC